jgi:AraC family transcriptional regulator, transcriptional activator of pobA
VAKQLFRERTSIPDKTFPINVFSVSAIGLHWHEHLELIYVREGCAQVQVESQTMLLHKGEAAFVNAKQIHAATPDVKSTNLVAIVFNESLLRNSGLDRTDETYFSKILSQSVQLPTFLTINHPSTATVRASIEAIVSEFKQKQAGFELFIKGEIFRVFGMLYRSVGVQPKPKSTRREHYSDFTPLIQHLLTHFPEEVNMRDAAQMVNLSPYHFCRMFKRTTGKTLVEYIHLLRVNQAEKMLLETESSISVIAEKVGFGSISYFSTVFKKHKNLTPTEYRRHWLEVSQNTPYYYQ